jgi:hypothetical protein
MLRSLQSNSPFGTRVTVQREDTSMKHSVIAIAVAAVLVGHAAQADDSAGNTQASSGNFYTGESNKKPGAAITSSSSLAVGTAEKA